MKNKRILGFGCAFGAAVLLSSPSFASVFSKVDVSGNKRIEKETILAYMKFNEKQDFNEKKMNDALKSLFATGLFADVKIYAQGNTLKVEVKENPIVSGVYFDGNSRLEKEQLESEVLMKSRSVYTKDKTAKDVRRLLELYRRSGRYAVTIEPKIIEREQNRVDVVYEIDEGPATYVRKILFIGNEQISDSDLKEAIMTKEDRWYRFLSSVTTYDPDRMAYDKELLRRFYMNNGYIDVKVLSAIGELTPDKEGFFITFNLSEGKRYKVRKVDVKTSLRGIDTESLMSSFDFKEGEWYNDEKIENVIQVLSDEAGNLGHAFVEVVPEVKKVPAGEDGELYVDITFNIKEGKRIFIDKIQIMGNVRTKDSVIRREFRLAEGDAFNAAKIRRSKQRIENLNYFSKVDVQTEKSDVLPDKTDINVNVEEKSTGSLTFGVGWSTYDGALVQAGISERNLLGTGRVVSLKGTIAQKRSEYDLSLTDPYFMDRNLSAGIDLFNISQDYQNSSSYDEDTIGGALRFGWSYNEKVSENVKYTLRQDDIHKADSNASLYIKEQAGKTITSMVSHAISYDVRNSTVRPTEGYVLTLSNDLAGLGGDNKFLRTDLYAAYYFPIAKDWTVAVKGHGGYIFGLGGEDVRINERYFLGGSNLRGFEQGGAAARTVNGDAIGGNWITTGTLELIFPLGLPTEFGLRGRVFSDIGVAGKPDDTKGKYQIDYSSEPRASVGFGISWDSPMGLINIDISHAVKKQDYDETEVFRLNFGTGF